MRAEIKEFRASVGSFNDQYAPKKASVKLASVVGLGGIGIPTLTLEIDLTGVKNSLFEAAQAKKDELTDEAARIEFEIGAMNLRAKELQDRGEALKARKAALDQAGLGMIQKEQIAVMDEMTSGVALTDFSDPDLANSQTEVNNMYAELSGTIMELAMEQQTPGSFDDEYQVMPGYGGF